MDKIGEIIKANQQSLTSQPNTSDTQEISLRSEPSMGLDQMAQWLRQQGAPEWEIALIAMAQDKRHDLPELTLESCWRAKLKAFRDKEICDALQLWAGEFFPCVDDVIGIIERRRELAAVNKPWNDYKAAQEQAAVEGKLATDEDYERLRAHCREIIAKAPVIRAAGRPKANESAGTEQANSQVSGS